LAQKRKKERKKEKEKKKEKENKERKRTPLTCSELLGHKEYNYLIGSFFGILDLDFDRHYYLGWNYNFVLAWSPNPFFNS